MTLTGGELAQLVSEYLDGRMSRRRRELFERHLVSCPPCRRYVEAVGEAASLLGHVPDEMLSEQAVSGLVEYFCGWDTAGD